jgi:sec-independent protein translocase protein TatA
MIGDLFDSPWKIAIVAVLIIVLFGSRKLPDAARSLGRSMRILKSEVQGMHEDEPAPGTATENATQTAPAQIEAQPQPNAQAQAQIDALQAQLNNLQSSVGTNGAAVTDTQRTQQPS